MFGLQDSPQGDSTVTYAAYPGETPVFSSGREIEGWKKVTAALPGLPEEANGNVWWRMSRIGSSRSTMLKDCCRELGRRVSFRWRAAVATSFIFPRAD